jgi:hypothetical protein
MSTVAASQSFRRDCVAARAMAFPSSQSAVDEPQISGRKR